MQKNSIKKNFTYQMIYEVLVLILPFVTSPYIARVIGPEGLGIYSYSNSVAYYFVLFSLLGIQNYGNRSIAQCRDNPEKLNRKFSSLVTVHIAVSLICVIAYLGYVAMLGHDQLYAAIQILFVLSGLFDISWFYFGIENFKLTVLRSFIIKILNVVCVFTFVRDSDDLAVYCLIMALGALLSQLSLWLPLHRYVSFVRPGWKDMKVHIKPLIILFIPAIAISIYKYMDKIMIGAMSSNMQLGFYENAEKVINIPMTVIAAFGTVMLPKMSNLTTNKNQKLFHEYIAQSMQFVMCLAFALSFGLAAVGRVFAPIFWGEGFTESGGLIMCLACTIPFVSFANVIRTQYLIPNSYDHEYLISVIAGAVSNLGINYLLIGRYGAWGAAIGTVIAEMTVCILQTLFVRKQLPIGRYLASIAVFLPIGAVMFVVVDWIGKTMKRSILTLLVQICCGALLYASAVVIYFLKTKNAFVLNELQRLRDRIAKRGS